MVIPTNVRPGRTSALFVAPQVALGTPISTFTTSHRWWTESGEVPTPMRWSKDASKSLGGAPVNDGAYGLPQLIRRSIRVIATPSILSSILTSTIGASYAQASQVSAAMRRTLLWVSDGSLADPWVTRIRDAWFHAATVRIDGHGRATVDVEYAARGWSNPSTASSLVISLPAAPMEPASKAVYPGALVDMTSRDPDANPITSFRIRSATLSFRNGLLHQYSKYTGQYEVWKAGPLRVVFEVEVDSSQDSDYERLVAITDGIGEVEVGMRTEAGLLAALSVRQPRVDIVESEGHDGRTHGPYVFRAEGTQTSGSPSFAVSIAT